MARTASARAAGHPAGGAAALHIGNPEAFLVQALKAAQEEVDHLTEAVARATTRRDAVREALSAFLAIARPGRPEHAESADSAPHSPESAPSDATEPWIPEAQWEAATAPAPALVDDPAPDPGQMPTVDYYEGFATLHAAGYLADEAATLLETDVPTVHAAISAAFLSGTLIDCPACAGAGCPACRKSGAVLESAPGPAATLVLAQRAISPELNLREAGRAARNYDPSVSGASIAAAIRRLQRQEHP